MDFKKIFFLRVGGSSLVELCGTTLNMHFFLIIFLGMWNSPWHRKNENDCPPPTLLATCPHPSPAPRRHGCCPLTAADLRLGCFPLMPAHLPLTAGGGPSPLWTAAVHPWGCHPQTWSLPWGARCLLTWDHPPWGRLDPEWTLPEVKCQLSAEICWIDNNDSIYKVQNRVCRDWYKCIHAHTHIHAQTPTSTLTMQNLIYTQLQTGS